MSETKWTVNFDDTGVVAGDPYVVIDDGSRAIAYVMLRDRARGKPIDEWKEHAYLLAAAPDLAEALEDMLGAHPPISKRIGFEGSPARRAQEDQEAAIAKARAALARAKGEA